MGIAALATVLALWINIADYENFLDLLGSVFIPMTGVFLMEFFILSKGRWDLAVSSRRRLSMLVPWVLGFVAYQLINPGYISWWVSMWTRIAQALDFRAASWMSALATLAAGAVTTVGRGRRRERDEAAPHSDEARAR